MNNKKHIEDILYYFEKYHYENMILDDNEAKFIHDYIINLQSKIDKAKKILNANTHVENIYRALCNLFDEEYQYEIDNEELNKILNEDK